MPKYKVSVDKKKFKVDATMDVGYSVIVEAYDEEQAFAIASERPEDFIKTDDGHDFTVERNVVEVTDKEVEAFWDKKFTGDG